MKFDFYKYEGTGNDFILIDNRKNRVRLNRKQIAFLCDRKFGIGADGLMLLQIKKGFDLEMKYYNSDGNESSFCGNGSRCIVSFAKKIKAIKKQEAKFIASDGVHLAKIISTAPSKNKVRVKMKDVSTIDAGQQSTISDNNNGAYYLLNTGSPHFVNFGTDVKQMDILPEAKKIRYSNLFINKGVNVNFVEKTPKGIYVRTYERGVENETLSCGTGVTAAALTSAMLEMATSQKHCNVETPGGKLTVHFNKGENASFTNVWLEGDATFVFKGQIEI